MTVLCELNLEENEIPVFTGIPEPVANNLNQVIISFIRDSLLQFKYSEAPVSKTAFALVGRSPKAYQEYDEGFDYFKYTTAHSLILDSLIQQFQKVANYWQKARDCRNSKNSMILYLQYKEDLKKAFDLLYEYFDDLEIS